VVIVGRETDRVRVAVSEVGPPLVELFDECTRGVLVREKHELGARAPLRRAVLAHDLFQASGREIDVCVKADLIRRLLFTQSINMAVAMQAERNRRVQLAADETRHLLGHRAGLIVTQAERDRDPVIAGDLAVFPFLRSFDAVPELIGICGPVRCALGRDGEGADDLFANFPLAIVVPDAGAPIQQAKAEAVSDAGNGRMAGASTMSFKVGASVQ
jgi:hypothetical protein